MGEDVVRRVDFDVQQIVEHETEEIEVQVERVASNVHFTEIELVDIHKFPQKKTITKIKEHLANIYRIFLRQGVFELIFDGEKLEYVAPNVLVAPPFDASLVGAGEPLEWIKEIELDFGLGWTINGFAALREVASTSHAGFALFRRNRLIEGSADDSYRPSEIFGSNNSFVYQRLFGELHIEGFNVTHTKDGFYWGDSESVVLECLYEALNGPPITLLTQARNYRVSPKSKEMKQGAEDAVEKTAEIVRKEAPAILERQIRTSPVFEDPPKELPKTTTASRRVIEVDFNDCHWCIIIELSDDPSIKEWVDICEHLIPSHALSEPQTQYLGIRFSLAHPFMMRFGGTNQAQIEPLLRVAVALALGETTARNGGAKLVGTVRRNVNQLLREALSK